MTVNDPLVTAVVLNWNESTETLACIDSLAKQTWANLGLLVIDNNSPVADFERLQAGADGVNVIRSETNLGFAGGVNVGLERAFADGADYVWLVNSDLTAPPETLARLVAAIDGDQGIGLASPTIRNTGDSGTIEFAGGNWRDDGSFETTVDPATSQAWAAQRPGRAWLVGTALLVRREAYERIGPFDDRLFAYWEDNDYSIRSLRAGFRSVVVAEAEVFHPSNDPRGDPSVRPPYYHYFMTRNEILLHWKHDRGAARVRTISWAIARGLARATSASDRRWKDALLLGIWDGVRGRGGPFVAARRLHSWGRLAVVLGGHAFVAATSCAGRLQRNRRAD